MYINKKKPEYLRSPGPLLIGLFPKCFGFITSSDFLKQAVIFHLWLSQRPHNDQNFIKLLIKNQYGAYVPESSSVVLITVTMKPVLQEPTEMDYSQDQYVNFYSL